MVNSKLPLRGSRTNRMGAHRLSLSRNAKAEAILSRLTLLRRYFASRVRLLQTLSGIPRLHESRSRSITRDANLSSVAGITGVASTWPTGRPARQAVTGDFAACQRELKRWAPRSPSKVREAKAPKCA